MISGKAGSMAKEKSPENYGENNMNLTLSHIKDIKKSQDFSVETITEIFYSSEDEKPRKYSYNVQKKDLEKT